MVTCKVESRWMASIETAFVMVTSPTNRSLTVMKMRYGNIFAKLTQDEQVFMWRIIEQQGNTVLTIDEMKMFKRIAELAK